MPSYTVGRLLDPFASWSPGRSAAALHAALGAALLARAARDEGTRAGETAHDLREVALGLAGDESSGSDPAARARAAVRAIEVARRALDLAETLRPVRERAAGVDVAAAAEALRAAVGTARVEVEVALLDIPEPTVREELLLAIDPVDDLVVRAAKVTAGVREHLPP